MANSTWELNGSYFEACSCDFPCPCVPTHLTAKPTYGHCDVPLAFHIEQGRFEKDKLDGLNFVVVVHAPGPMADGNWTVGVVIDERATAAQRAALEKIASGAAGGPIASLAGLIGTFKGFESKPIYFEQNGLRRTLRVPGLIDFSIEGVTGADGREPIYLENAPHPASTKLAWAKGGGTHVDAFGIRWDEKDGKNNGHFSPFSWQS